MDEAGEFCPEDQNEKIDAEQHKGSIDHKVHITHIDRILPAGMLFLSDVSAS